MICFDITINGSHVCRAGGADVRMLSAGIDWARLAPQKQHERRLGYGKGQCVLAVRGFTADERYPEWLWRLLRVGDVVTITIVQAETADKPTGHYMPASARSVAAMTLASLRHTITNLGQPTPKALAFDVAVNDNHVCVAGVGETGVLNAMLTHIKRTAAVEPAGDDPQWDKLRLEVGGVVQRNGGDEQMYWKVGKPALGDTITIKIVPHGPTPEAPRGDHKEEP